MERAGFSVEPGYSVDGYVIPLEERPTSAEILFSREPVIETLSDPGLDAESRESMERWARRPASRCPCASATPALGVLVVCETERERRFTPRSSSSRAGSPPRRRPPCTTRACTATSRSGHDRARGARPPGEAAQRPQRGAQLQPRPAHRARLGLPAHLRAARRHRRRDWARCEGSRWSAWRRGAAGAFVEEWVGRRYPADHWTASSLAMDWGDVATRSMTTATAATRSGEVMHERDQRSLLAVPMKARGASLGRWRSRRRAATGVHRGGGGDRGVVRAHDGAGRGQRRLLFERQAADVRRLTSLLEASQALTSSLAVHEALETLSNRRGSRWLSRGASSSSTPEAGHADHALGAPGVADGVPGPRQLYHWRSTRRTGRRWSPRTSSWSPSPTLAARGRAQVDGGRRGEDAASPAPCGSATGRSARRPSSRRTPSAVQEADPEFAAAPPSRPS